MLCLFHWRDFFISSIRYNLKYNIRNRQVSKDCPNPAQMQKSVAEHHEG